MSSKYPQSSSKTPANSQHSLNSVSIGCLPIPVLTIVGIVLFPPYFCIDMCPHHANTEAISKLNNINRAQQAYFLENDTFTSSLKELEIQFETETNNYSLNIFQTSQRISYVYAISKNKKLYSYIGAVFATTTPQSENLTVSIICGLDEPELAKTALPTFENQQPVCAKKGSWKWGERSTSAKYQQELWRWWQFWHW
jgi:type IV pilus assembly protein PilA